MRISCLQLATPVFDREKNFEAAERAVRGACEKEIRPDILLLPELWNVGYFPKTGLQSEADPDGERTRTLMGGLAAEYGVNIAAGSVVTLREGRVYNTAYAFDRKGRLVSSYDKIHQFAPMHENERFTSGDRIEVFSLDGVCCGWVVCYDIRFPELSRKLYLQGAELLLSPVQAPAKNIYVLQTLGRARAIENECYFVCCNSTGHCFGRDYLGGSYGSDRLGTILAQAGKEPCEISFSIDIETIREARRNSCQLSARKPSVY